jgi:hypothetical protein
MGDIGQSIALERRALAAKETFSEPSVRASSHNNLSNYLDRSGVAALQPEAARHQLAALAYQLAAGLGEDLKTSFGNYVRGFRRARADRREPVIPRLAELLADPAFDALARWLKQRGVDPDELQQAIDQFLAAASEATHPSLDGVAQ